MNKKTKVFCYVATVLSLSTCVYSIYCYLHYYTITQKTANIFAFFNIVFGSVLSFLYSEKLTKCMCWLLTYGGLIREENSNVSFNRSEMVTIIYFLYFLTIFISASIDPFLGSESFLKTIISAFSVFAAFEKTIDKYQKTL